GREQAYVVEQIGEALRPLADGLTVSGRPRARQVGNIYHLETPISANLREDVEITDVIEALHPTPAVGGLPMREAADWSTAHEAAPRGWYAGGVGWLDANGDGTIAVAIRSGVVTDDRAYIYTGAGIVDASDPDAEYEETALKQGAFLRALGLEDPI